MLVVRLSVQQYNRGKVGFYKNLYTLPQATNKINFLKWQFPELRVPVRVWILSPISGIVCLIQLLFCQFLNYCYSSLPLFLKSQWDLFPWSIFFLVYFNTLLQHWQRQIGSSLTSLLLHLNNQSSHGQKPFWVSLPNIYTLFGQGRMGQNSPVVLIFLDRFSWTWFKI